MEVQKEVLNQIALARTEQPFAGEMEQVQQAVVTSLPGIRR